MNRCKMRSFNKLSDFTQRAKHLERETALVQNISMIEELKNRIHVIENKNERVAEENSELRQFSMDGY